MMRSRDFSAIVVGSGPVGMIAALQLSQRCRTALIAHRLPSPADPPSVEAVPAPLLALLLEFGIHPQQIGVDRLFETRFSAWETATPMRNVGPAMAHVERPALDLALLSKVLAAKRLKIVTGRFSTGRLQAMVGPGWGKCRLLDGSGKRAVSANEILRPGKPWASRSFWVASRGCPASREFRMAALPGGYVYRLGAAGYVGFGRVGRGKMLTASAAEFTRQLRRYAADWVLDGLPPIDTMQPGKVAPASVQWAAGNSFIAIGDAALARDPLSSQGLSCGISEALYAAAIDTLRDEQMFLSRQAAQRSAHLQALTKIIASCRHRDEDAWKGYAEFVARHVALPSAGADVSLRDGRILLPVA